MKKVEDFAKFEFSKLSKTDLKSISGGVSGIETDTCHGTTKVTGAGGIPDSSRDGDWYSTC